MEHYVEKVTTEIGTFWEWKDISNLAISQKQKGLLLKIFNSRTIMLRDEEDRIIWCVVKSGKYSAYLGYQLSCNREDMKEWPYKLCWD